MFCDAFASCVSTARIAFASAAAFFGGAPASSSIFATCATYFFAQLDRLRVRLQVVVAVGQPEPAPAAAAAITCEESLRSSSDPNAKIGVDAHATEAG